MISRHQQDKKPNHHSRVTHSFFYGRTAHRPATRVTMGTGKEGTGATTPIKEPPLGQPLPPQGRGGADHDQTIAWIHWRPPYSSARHRGGLIFPALPHLRAPRPATWSGSPAGYDPHAWAVGARPPVGGGRRALRWSVPYKGGAPTSMAPMRGRASLSPDGPLTWC